MLIADATDRRPVRYWKADPFAEIRYPRPEHYAERFRELFAEAVRCRMFGEGPIGCLFSGGVDSSAIVSMAGHLGPDFVSRLEAFAMVFPAAPIDDRQYTEAVRAKYGVRVNYVTPPAIAPVRTLGAAVQHHRLPFIDAHHQTVNALYAACAARGCRVVLTGLRGDDLFGGVAYRSPTCRNSSNCAPSWTS